MIDLVENLGLVIFLLTVTYIVFPILSLIVINMILNEKRKGLRIRILYNCSFIALFLIFQQNQIPCIPGYLVFLVENLITVVLLIYLGIKLFKIWKK